MNIAIIIIIAIMISIIFIIYKNKKSENEYFNASLFNSDKKKGLQFIKETKKNLHKKPKDKAKQYFQIANVYRYNIQDQNEKLNNYYNTLVNLENSIALNDYDKNLITHLLNKILADNVDGFVKDYANNIYNLFNDIETKKLNRLEQEPVTVIPQIIPAPIIQDNHNVHDSQVIKDLKVQYKHMLTTLNDIPSDGVEDLYSHLTKLPDSKQKQDALVSFNRIKGNLFSALDEKEEIIMYTIWRRIHHPCNQDNIDSLKIAFVEALADASPNGNTVCMTGRVTRLFAALAKIDPIYGVLKSEPLVKQEIMNKAGALMLKFNKENKQFDDVITGKDLSKERQYNTSLLKYINEAIIQEYSWIESKKLDAILNEIKEGFV